MKYQGYEISIAWLRNGRFGYAILYRGAYRSFGDDRQFNSIGQAIDAAIEEIESQPIYLNKRGAK